MLRELVFFGMCAWSSGVCAAKNPVNYERFFTMLANTTDFTRGFHELMERMQEESEFFGFFLLRNKPADCVDEQLPENFALPLLQVNASYPVYVRGTGNSYLLAIVCVKNFTDKEFVLKFAKDLQHLRKRRTLVIFNGNLASSAESEIVKFFQYCEELKFIDIVLIHRDFATTHIYHSFNQFPEFELETHDMRSTAHIYPIRFTNVAKKSLRILVEQIEPSTIIAKGEDGETYLAGYIGYFITTFVERYNFSLQIPDEYNSSINCAFSSREILQSAHNGSIDVGASLSTPQKEENLHEYIYPIEFFQYLTMLPVEAPLETYQFFIKFFRPTVIVVLFVIVWLLCLIAAVQEKLARRTLRCNRNLLLLLITPWNLDLLRCLLCQSTNIHAKYLSVSRRIIFILIFSLGGLLSNFFSTNLAKWLTVPPHEEFINKFSQAADRNIQIQIPESYIAELKFYRGEDFWNKYSHVFKVTKTVEEFQSNIRKMDSRYGYAMSSLAWSTIEERQKYFARPIFRLSESLYYTKGSLLSLPTSDNSIYKDLLSDFYLRTRENGLLSHWFKNTFFAMVMIGHINFEDLSQSQRHDVLTLKEFEWVWMAYGVGMVLSVLTFLVELLWRKFRRITKA
ncbi:uncharacterized protein LOC128865354 [Anastrepha ludens]|uniref:uncharacterized protein LOC128865354 n=1 Tax=Anastrepha ludens TaxID=28586 RepID=UPI0023AF0C2E|nr:uncharacterized protein LOC128865354 [Anastrepha ludens]